jgi:rhodanese-related sulfurtransferase
MCGPNRTIHELAEYAPGCTAPPASADESLREDEIREVTVQELKQKLQDSSKKIYLLDVREPEEWKIARIEGAVLKPLSTLKKKLSGHPQRQTRLCPLQGRRAQLPCRSISENKRIHPLLQRQRRHRRVGKRD